MNGKQKLYLLLGLISLSFGGMHLLNEEDSPGNEIIFISRAKITKSLDILKRKSKISETLLNTSATSSACTLFLKDSAEQTMLEYTSGFLNHHIDEILNTCKGALPNLLQEQFDKTFIECNKSTSENISKTCYQALIQNKSASVAAIIKHEINPDELEPPTLVQLMASQFNSGSYLEFPENTLAILDALIEKEPTYLLAYKAKLLLLISSSLNKDDQYKEIFKDTLDAAKKLTFNDFDIQEIELAYQGKVFQKALEEVHNENVEEQKNRTDFVDYLKKQSLKHPKDWIYDYYQAHALYDGNKTNHEQTIILIENALKKAPLENRLKKTLENLKSDDEQKKLHPFILGFELNLIDL